MLAGTRAQITLVLSTHLLRLFRSTPHPKLPGTIYTAAEEIERAGGKALPLIVDIRQADQVQDAIEQTVKKFGGLDIVINNASAISLTPTQKTPVKTYDLMNSINSRGTYLTSAVSVKLSRQIVFSSANVWTSLTTVCRPSPVALSRARTQPSHSLIRPAP